MDQVEKLKNDVVKLDAKVHQNEETLKVLIKSYADLQTNYASIDKRLAELLFLNTQSKERFDHHQLQCQELWDERYVMKGQLSNDVLQILKTVRHEDLNHTNNVVTAIKNFFYLATQVVVIIAAGVYALTKLGIL